jgi:ABC-type transport system substrate-binding protein
MRDIKSQAPDAICELTQTPVAINLLVNREAPPFDDPDIRRAMQLTIDRKSFIDIIAEGQGDVSGAMLPPPAGLWGLPTEILKTLPGYGPDVQGNRAEARKLMEKHGYGPDKRLPVKVATRNIAQYRDPAVILIDQMKEIYIDGELDTVETANWGITVTVYLSSLSSGSCRLVSPSIRGFGPGLPGARRRPSCRSSAAIHSGAPSGRPIVGARSIRAVVAGSAGALSSAAKSGITVAGSSSSPARWARALDHGQSSARLTSPADTGLSVM